MHHDRRVRSFLALLTLFIGWTLPAAVYSAANLGISPIILSLPAGDLATAVEITNNGDAHVTLQTRVHRWTMLDGQSRHIESRDLFVSPPLFRIAPGATQVVRVGRLKPVAAPANEQAYRLELMEVRDETRQQTAVLATLLKVFLPLFVPPAEPDSRAEPRLNFTAVRSSAGSAALKIENQSNLRAEIGRLTLARGDATIAERRLGRYVLAGSSMTLEWPEAQGALAEGPVTIKAQVNNHFEVAETLRLSGR